MREPMKWTRLPGAARCKKTARATGLVLASVLCAASPGCAGRASPPRPEPRATDEHIAIRALLDEASDAINHHEWAALVSLLAEDVVWERLPPHPWKLEGRDAILSFLAQNEATLDVLFYDVSAPAIRLDDPEHATARSTLSETLRFKKTGAIIRFIGTYHDQFARRDGRWVLTRRTFQARYEEDGAGPVRVFDGAASPSSALDTVGEPTGQTRP